MMVQHPMVEQVNRLVGNLLAGGGELFLPGVGSLYSERHGAKRLSKRTVEPPCRTIGFSSQQRGVSLVGEIARVIRESEAAAKERPEGMRSTDGPSEFVHSEAVQARAQDIYERWLARTREADVLTITGVGVLRHKFFTPDEAFDARINPQGHAPVRIKSVRRFDWALAVGLAAILAAAGIGGYEFLTLFAEDGTQIRTETVGREGADPAGEGRMPGRTGTVDPDAAGSARERTVPVQPADAANVGPDVRTKDAAAPAVQTETAATESTPAAASAYTGEQSDGAALRVGEQHAARPAQPSAAPDEAPASLVSGRRYVVLGVFSTPENAARAAREAARKDGALRFGIYRFGGKFMVSPYESVDAEACRQFIRAHAGEFPGMWSYTAR